MGKVRPKLTEVKFACNACGHRWAGEPGRVLDVVDKSHHPWDYFADCPECGVEAGQDPREAALLKAWANATGPRSPEGKARSAANLEGHPTPEEARRTRFNALKHGMSADVATYFPARPGRYDECDGCPYWDQCFDWLACQRKTELFLTHHIAFEAGDPSMLQGLRARMHAAISAVIDMCIQKVISQGVTLEHPAWYYDKEGGFHLASWTDDKTGQQHVIREIKEHPLLKRIGDLVKATGMSLSDTGMTMAVQQAQDDIPGELDDRADRETVLEYQRRQAEALENLGGLIEASRKDAARDPIAIEHQQANAD